jgi:hypothetical protein
VKYRAAAVGAGSNLDGPICRCAQMPGPWTGALGRVDDRIDGASPPAISGGAPQARISVGSGGRGDAVCDSYRLEVAVDGDVFNEG